MEPEAESNADAHKAANAAESSPDRSSHKVGTVEDEEPKIDSSVDGEHGVDAEFNKTGDSVAESGHQVDAISQDTEPAQRSSYAHQVAETDPAEYVLEGTSTEEVEVHDFEKEHEEAEETGSSESRTADVKVQDFEKEHEEADGTGSSESRKEQESSEEDVPQSTELPAELSSCVKVLHLPSSSAGQCTVYLVGTAHVLEESCKQVKAVINYVKPKMVFLELCHGRENILMPPKKQVPKSLAEVLRSGEIAQLYAWFLQKAAEEMEVFPGGEFRAAFEEAQKCNSLVFLGDRPVQITLQRMWRKLSLWHRIKFVYMLVVEGCCLPGREELQRMLSELKDKDMLTYVIQKLGQEFPVIIQTLLTERDMYMAAMLQGVSQHVESVVAVVGMGHVRGIVANIDLPIDLDPLLDVPPSSRRKPILLAIAAGGLLLGIGIYVFKRR